MSRAPSPAGVAPAPSSASQSAGAASGVEQELDAVLARVAGAADERLGAGDARASPCASAAAARRRPARRRSRAPRALHGEHRVVVDRVGDLGVEAAGVLREPGEVALVVGGVGDRQVAVVGEPVGEQVVEDAAVLAAEAPSTARRRPRASRRRWRAAAAGAPRRSGPARSRSRPCARRRRRRRRCAPRGARRRTPSYCTGISQPANGTSLRARGDVRARRGGCASSAAAAGHARAG